MWFEIVRFEARSSFVFTWNEDGEQKYRVCPYWPSDTFWGKINCMWEHPFSRLDLFRLQNDGYRHHGGQPPFLVSSLFPYQKNVLYFPVPHGFVGEREWEGTQFISQTIFEEIVRGERKEISPAVMQPTGIALSPWDAIKLRQIEPLYQTVRRVRNTGRRGLDPNVERWEQHEIHMSRGSGLYSLVAIRDDYRSQFEACLRYMADCSNIGARQRDGHGRVDFTGIETVELKVPEVADADGFVTLSLAAAESFNAAEFQPTGSTMTSRGWIYGDTQGHQKRPTEMWVEGSWFEGDLPQIEYRGLIDVTTEGIDFSHPIYRYGYPFAIPCKKGGYNE